MLISASFPSGFLFYNHLWLSHPLPFSSTWASLPQHLTPLKACRYRVFVLLVIFGFFLGSLSLDRLSLSPHGQTQSAGHVPSTTLPVLDPSRCLWLHSLLLFIIYNKNFPFNHTLEQFPLVYTSDTETLKHHLGSGSMESSLRLKSQSGRLSGFCECSCVQKHVGARGTYVLLQAPLTLLRPAGQ